MKEILPKISNPEFRHIDISDPRLAEMWSSKFGCTESELKEAIKKVGSSEGAIRAELGKRVPLKH